MSSEKHQKHDKIIRDILNDKEEVVKIINKYIKPKEKLKKEEIEKYETSYITKNFQNKEADIVYKLKGKEVYFLIEHQTKVEKSMAYRMAEYSLEIIRSRVRDKILRTDKYPKVLPVVIYTGIPKWTAKIKFEEMQEEYELEEYITKNQFGYNLIDIRNPKEAIEDDLLISKVSILEKSNNIEELLYIIDKISNKITKEDKRENLQRIIEYLFEDTLQKGQMEEIKEMLKNRKGSDTLHVHEILRRDREKSKKEGVIMVAKRMLEEKMDVNLIMKITGLKKEQFMK